MTGSHRNHRSRPRSRPFGVITLAGALCLLSIGAIAVTDANAAVNTYTATLSGNNEVPAIANGYTGSATITIDTVSFQVCVTATTNVPGSDPIILDHIHSGAAGTTGPIVVDFMNNLNTCVTSNATTVGNIVANPGNFYFNVHTETYQSGALRGQLVLQAPSTSSSSTSTSTSTTSTTSTTVRAVTVSPTFTG